MGAVSKLAVATLFVLCTQLGFSQQLRLGKDPYNIEKSAVLELYSDNQGLLLPRIADTSLINVLTPPDGMIIYFTPAKKLLIRANGSWQTLAVNNAVVTSLNGNTGALTIDTGYINNFYSKVRSELSAGPGINYDAGTGVISSSINTGNFWNTSGNSGTNPSGNFIGTIDNQDLVFKTNNTEAARFIASSGDIKIGSATSGTLRSTQELVLRQDGDTYGSSILRLRNRTAENGAIFETTDPSITLVDFIFKTAVSQRNIRYEARSGYAKAGTPSFHIGGASPDNPTLAVGDSYAAFNTNLKIGNYNTPTEALDVTGNVRFSGALMPNNNAGTSGYVLSSSGAGVAPTWRNFTLANLNDVTITSPSNGQLIQYNGTGWVNTTASYLTSVDTSNISNFYLKVRSLHTVSSPLTYNSSTGLIGITQASSSSNGYLSSTDWNTFNNKSAALTFSTGLTNSSNTITNNLSTGISSSNQNIYGSTAANGTLTLNSTTNATKGKILFGNSAYDESNNFLTIGTTTSQNRITLGNASQEAISRDIRTGSLEIMGGTSEATGAYFQITGDQHTGSPYEGSAEFVIRNFTNSQFAMFSYDGAGSWAQRFQLKGASGDTYLTPNGGKVSVGGITPTAGLQLSAGTAAANTAPLKLTAGTNLTTPEDGAIEYNGTHFYATVGSTRYQLDQQSGSGGLDDPGSNGIIARTALNTTTTRTLTGTTNRVSVTNGNGVSGNPTIDISASFVGQSSITTLGTITTGTWNGNTIGIANGGTGQTTANAAFNALAPSQTGNSGLYLTTDGSNTSWNNPNVTAANFLYAYSTSTKTFSSAGSWADITFNTAHPQINGWSHSLSSNAQNFTCNQTGIYQIVYSGQVNNNSPANTYELDVRATLNGSEISGSVSSVQCSNSNPTITNNFLVSVSSGDVLKLQLTGSNTNMRLQAGTYGSVRPTITITIVRIQ